MNDTNYLNPIKNKWLTRDELAQLHKLNSWRSVSRIICEYILIACIIKLNFYYGSFPIYLISVVLIGSRQHALMVLLHDAAHFSIAKNKKVNDIIGTVMGWTVLASLRGYRRHHLGHHIQKNLNTMKDPDYCRKQNKDWQFPMKKKSFFFMILKDLTGLNAYEYIVDARASKNILFETHLDKLIVTLRFSFYILCGVIFTVYSLWVPFILYWIIPFFTYLKFVFRFRSIADHFVLSNKHLYDRTRTIIPNILERILIAPCNISIHNEHHIYGSVPYYNLKKLHFLLAKNPNYRSVITLDPGYLWLIKERLTY